MVGGALLGGSVRTERLSSRIERALAIAANRTGKSFIVSYFEQNAERFKLVFTSRCENRFCVTWRRQIDQLKLNA